MDVYVPNSCIVMGFAWTAGSEESGGCWRCHHWGSGCSVTLYIDTAVLNGDCNDGCICVVCCISALFQNKSSRGQDKANDGDTLWTSHESAITCMQDASLAVPAKSTTFPSDVSVTRVSTSGLDGALVTWNLPTLNNIDFASLNV